ncbi:MAG: prepilin-type N-terminal cleavage/methylation domain-containing protein [Gammaproteobacteria bacterium]
MVISLQHISHVKKVAGFTLVELLVTLLVVAVISTVSTPGVSSFIVNAALDSAQNNITLSIQKAKNIARSTNSSVTLSVTENSNQIILLSADSSFSQTIDMPTSVFSLSTVSFQFNPFGLVNNTGTITLKSARDGTQARKINIVTLLGQITVT